MIVELVTPTGSSPITVPAMQFVVRDQFQNPIAIGAEYGPEGAQDVSVRQLPDFNRTMKVLGINSTIIIDPTRTIQAVRERMTIEIVPRIGMPAVFSPASRFVVYQDNGTPIVAGTEFGLNHTPAVTMVGLPDFQKLLRTFGIRTTVVVETLQMPKPQPGARLVAGPKE